VDGRDGDNDAASRSQNPRAGQPDFRFPRDTPWTRKSLWLLVATLVCGLMGVAGPAGLLVLLVAPVLPIVGLAFGVVGIVRYEYGYALAAVAANLVAAIAVGWVLMQLANAIH